MISFSTEMRHFRSVREMIGRNHNCPAVTRILKPLIKLMASANYAETVGFFGCWDLHTVFEKIKCIKR